MDISIIGSGQVGKRIGKTFAKGGHKVIFYDVFKGAFRELEKYRTTLDINEALKSSEMSFLAVPTPVKSNHTYDMSYLEKASKAAGGAIRNKKKYHVFVVKSTVTPGTTEEVIIPHLEDASSKKNGKGFGVIYNPEFLTVIENTWTDDKSFHISADNEGRIVVGEGSHKRAGDILENFYNDTIFEFTHEKVFEDENSVLYRKTKRPVPVSRTDYMTAEFTKLFANNRLPLVISYTNELHLIDEELKENGINIDFEFAVKMTAKDPRIGKYGSVYGKAWGGPCFKKDSVVFRKWLSKKTGRTAQLINATIEVNNKMKEKYGERE